MGMYNEVFKKCPHCPEGVGYMQIGQIVLGFGGFDLDEPSTLEKLSLEDLRELRGRVATETFNCRRPGGEWVRAGDDENVCGDTFRHPNKEEQDERDQIIREFTQ